MHSITVELWECFVHERETYTVIVGYRLYKCSLYNQSGDKKGITILIRCKQLNANDEVIIRRLNDELYIGKLHSGVCQVKCVSFKIFLTGSFYGCRICMSDLILFILENTCLHPVIHRKLVAD